MKTIILLWLLTITLLAFSHEGHNEMRNLSSESVVEAGQEGRPTSWTQWVGSFHLIFLHFPIALINMLVVSELLWGWNRKPIFEFSSRFLLIASAIVTPFTALLGLIYSYFGSYEGLREVFLWWHMWCGIATAVLVLALPIIKDKSGPSTFYYGSLFILFLLVNGTSFFGGGMTHGPYHMFLPS